MTIAAVLVPHLYAGYIMGGLEGASCEIRHVLVNVIGGANFASQSNLEYAVWPASQLASLSTPTYAANDGTTNSSGEFVLDVSGTWFPGQEVIIAVRQSAGAAGGDDDNWGIGVDVVTPS